MLCVERATDMCLSGEVQAMVTCPISKEAISAAGYDFPGHTEFIAERSEANSYLMMMVSGSLRMGLVTAHIPLGDVRAQITQAGIASTISVMADALRSDFGIEQPRIAVLGLNPHAGDGGVLGKEETDIIIPAIRSISGDTNVSGPFPADGFFGRAAWKSFDGVVAMYHDQGLVPFKTLSFGKGVNVTAGLPIVRTSPDHGTAFDIAGRGVAEEGSLHQAILLAAEITARRASA
jgi:4-hydroxythreonine-4-phosphate dehydrogenase